MHNFRRWPWQTWAIIVMGILIGVGQIAGFVGARDKYLDSIARDALPTTAELFHVSYVQLARDDDGHLVVFTDAGPVVDFEGRYKVALREVETSRYAWTPTWSAWIDYKVAASGTHYRQPETLQWWANRSTFVEPPPNAWVMETCWQARIEDDRLGLTELEPVCVSSILDKDDPSTVQNEAPQ